MIGFSNSFFLWATVAAGIPVLVHLLTKRRARLIHYPTVRFLREAAAGRQALYRVRTVLILACRCLAVAALVLLFAKPSLKGPDTPDDPNATRRTAVILDATLSMQQVIGGVSLFDRAKTEVADLLRGLSPGTEALVILSGAESRPLLPTVSSNIPALYQRIAAAKPTMAYGSHADALSDAFQRLGPAGSVYIFSDFQQVSWQGISMSPPEGISVFFRPVTDHVYGNLAVTHVAVSPPLPVAKEPVSVEATLLNGTDKSLEESVVLAIGDETQRKMVRLDPLTAQTVRFNVTLQSQGEFEGFVKLTRTDSLDADNTRFFTIRVRSVSTVLIISDQNPEDPSSAPFYLSAAVSPFPESGTGIRAVCRHSQDLDAAAIDSAQVFILYPPLSLTPATASLICHRIASGTGLLVFLDGPSSADLLHVMDASSEGRIIPPFDPGFVLEYAEGDPQSWVDIQYDRRPLKLFHQAQGRGLEGVKVQGYLQTRPAESSGSTILARYPDGSCALAATSAGRGRVLWANLPVAPARSNLAASPLLPALIHEYLSFLNSGGSGTEGRPGMRWEVILPEVDSHVVPEVVSEEGQRLDSQTISLSDRKRLVIQPPEKPGIYQIRDGARLIAKTVVNIDPRESDFRRIAPETLVEVLAGEAGRAQLVKDSGRVMDEGEKPLWPTAALCAALFLLVEMLVLALWGRPSRN